MNLQGRVGAWQIHDCTVINWKHMDASVNPFVAMELNYQIRTPLSVFGVLVNFTLFDNVSQHMRQQTQLDELEFIWSTLAGVGSKVGAES